MKNKNIEYIKSILPPHYEINEKETATSIRYRCISQTGITDEEAWGYIWRAIKQQFGERFLEIDHTTCTYHINFDIWIKHS